MTVVCFDAAGVRAGGVVLVVCVVAVRMVGSWLAILGLLPGDVAAVRECEKLVKRVLAETDQFQHMRTVR